METVAATLPLPTPTNLNEAYDYYCRMLLNSAGKYIPRGRREAYIPCWDEECEDLLFAHKDANSNEERDTAGSDLHNRLNEKRRERWTDMVESIVFTHSSRRAWHTIKLTGRINTSPPCPITANSIATTLVRNGRFPNAGMTFARQTNSNVHKLRRAPSVDSNLSGELSPEEMKTALKHLKSGKSPGLDNNPSGVPPKPRSKGYGMDASLLLVVPPLLQISKDLATLQSDCHPQAQQAPGRPKRVPADCSPMCSLQVP